MKFRHGFVSNSSSSSFLIGFNRKPKTSQELRAMLFGDMEYLQYYDTAHKTSDIADIIFNDLKGKRELSPARLEKELEGDFPGCPYNYDNDRLSDKLERQFSESFPQYKGGWWHNGEIKETMAKQLVEKIYDARDKEQKEDDSEIKVALDKYMKSTVLPMMKGKKVYSLEYSDHDHAAIEHGDVFVNIPSIRISHH